MDSEKKNNSISYEKFDLYDDYEQGLINQV